MQNDPSFFRRAATLENVWAVKPTGNFENDCNRGRAYAQEFAANAVATYRN
jgi:hypothetical protein